MKESPQKEQDMDIYVARQPIFNRNMNLFGYELLYRRSENNYFENTDPSGATTELVHNTFLLMDFNKLTDGTRGFINFNQELMEQEIPGILPKDKVVIEILENVEASQSVIDACKKLKSDGFTLALDDFIFNRDGSDYTPLIELADIIKIEFSYTDKQEQRNLIKKYKNKIIFLAEKVETREEYREAVEMGYELFQGYFFCKPLMVKAKEIGTINVHLLHILRELDKQDPDFFFIADTIQRDMGLSYKLLKMANSIYFGGTTIIKNMRHAVVRLGIQEMRRWISIMLLREFENDENKELIKICLLRGKLLAFIAREINQEHLETDYFLTGLFSSIDMILGEEKQKILNSLALSDEAKEALILGSGEIADFLESVLLYERFEFDQAREKLIKRNITLERYMDLYMDALAWLKSTNG